MVRSSLYCGEIQKCVFLIFPLDYSFNCFDADKGWTTTHGFFVSMGGFILSKDGVMTKTLVIEELEQLASEGKIDWPSISEQEIQDKSKGDPFSKGFVVLQTTWFIIQCVARGITGLNLTELELATVAFAVLNGIVYLLWWNKPLDVACPVPVYLLLPTTSYTPRPSSERGHSYARETPSVYLRRPTTSDASSKLFLPSSSQHFSAFTRFRAYVCQNLGGEGLFTPIYFFIIKPSHLIWSTAIDILECDSMLRDSSVPTFYAPWTPLDYRAAFLGAGVGVLFGGIHCIAWTFSFQSVPEQDIWRISSVTITAMPIVILVAFGVEALMIKYEYTKPISNFTQCLCLFLYCVSRAALLVLPLLALRSLSPESLLDFQWSAFIPHI